MSTWTYTAETGLPNATDVTTANSGSGSAGFGFDAVTKAGGGTVRFSTASPLAGALSLEFGAATTGDVGRVDITTLFSSTNIVLDVAYRTPNYPTQGCRILELLSGAGSVLRINVNTSGKLEAYNAANTLVWTSTASVSTATTGWRVGVRCVAGATTSDGRLEVSYYSAKTDTTAAEQMTTITNGNLGTVAQTQLRVGKITSAPVWAAMYADDFQISDTRTTLFNAPASGGATNVWTYTAETGLSSGTDVTTGNSGSGTAGFAFDAVTKAGAGTVKYSGSSPLAGSLSLAFGAATTGDVGRVDITSLFSSTNVTVDVAYRTPNYPDLTCRVLELLSAGGSVLRVNVAPDGKLEAYNAANTLVWTSTASVNTGVTGWRIGVRCVAGSTTSDGRLELAYYSSYGNSFVSEQMSTITNGNFGTAAITQMRVGKITSAPVWAAVYADDLQISDNRNSLFGSPPGGGVLVNAGPDQTGVEPWSLVTITATTQSGSVTWQHISGPNPALSGSGLSRTFTAPADFTPQTSVFRASDNGQQDDVSVTYLPATDGIVASVGPVVVTPVRITRVTS